MWTEALIDAGDAYSEAVSRSESAESTEADGEVLYSFRNTKSGMANDELSPYEEELKKLIIQRGDYIVDSYDKLVQIANLAFDNPTLKATAYFGIINSKTLKKINDSVPNLPKEIDVLFKTGKSYSIAVTLDGIRHIVDDKALSRDDVISYLDRLADTIIEFETVSFDYYTDSYKNKVPGLLFKKTFNDGTIVSFELISQKKRSLSLQTLYMYRGDYQKKKAAKTLLMNNLSHTSKTRVGQPSNNRIAQNAENVNTQNKELHSDRDNAGRITADMTDTERAEILRKKEIVAPVYKGEADALIEREGGLEKQSKSFIKDALERIGEEFEVFTEYDIKDVDLKIILSANNLRESIHKEATPAQIAKLLPILRDTLENAKGIERHNNRYYYDNYTVDFENLLGAYIDGEYIVPVRFGLKHGKMGETTLYVLIDQEKIKAEVIKKAPSIIKLKPSSSRSAYVYSIAQIIPFVNSKDCH